MKNETMRNLRALLMTSLFYSPIRKIWFWSLIASELSLMWYCSRTEYAMEEGKWHWYNFEMGTGLRFSARGLPNRSMWLQSFRLPKYETTMIVYSFIKDYCLSFNFHLNYCFFSCHHTFLLLGYKEWSWCRTYWWNDSVHWSGFGNTRTHYSTTVYWWTSSYSTGFNFWHEQSQLLATCIQKELVKRLLKETMYFV